MGERAAVEPSQALPRTRIETPRTVDLGDRNAPRETSRDRSHCTLTIIGGGAVGTVVSLGRVPVVLGRGEPCELRFDDPCVSYVHAQIERANGRFYVRDMNSTNGTFVNGVPVTVPRELSDGDRIQIGRRGVIRVGIGGPDDALVSRKLYERAVRDRLTGLYNRSFFDERLEAEHGSAWRHGLPLALIMLDIDHFKQVNDTWGHEAGDAALRAVGALLEAAVREVDIAARFGGEEFVVLLPETTMDGAKEFAERLRRRVEDEVVTWKDQVIPLSVSLGVSAVPECVTDPAELLQSADAALYQAKIAGRNRVVTATSAG